MNRNAIRKFAVVIGCVALCVAGWLAQVEVAARNGTGNRSAAAAQTLQVCGTLNSLTAVSITVGLVSLPLAPGANITGTAPIGAQVCFDYTLNLAGLVTGGSLSVQGGTTATVCGTLNAFSGTSITVGTTSLPIAAGADIQGLGTVALGANVCLTYTLNAQGQISNGSISAQGGGGVTATVCGVLNALTANSITIGTTVVPIATGANIQGTGQTPIGSNVCLTYTANAQGQLTDGSISIQAGQSATVCGVLNAVSGNSITVGATVLPIAAGADIQGIGQAALGANVCLTYTLNAQGQISNGSISVQGGGGVTATVCGVLNALTANSITIGTTVIPIATGADIQGTGQTPIGANVCLTYTTNAQGQITNGSISIQGGTTATVCGVLNALTANSITVGSTVLPIAAGADIQGIGQATLGANVCLTYTLNAQGQISNGSISVTGSQTLTLCGVLNAVSANSLTIGTTVLPIAAGADIQGIGQATVGSNVCLTYTLNAQGQISNGSISVTAGQTLTVCGVLNALSATSVTVGSTVLPIATGATIAGANGVTVGANVCLTYTLNAQGQISNGSITATATQTFTICGVVSAVSATSITVGATSLPIAAGANIQGINLATVGANICLTYTLNAQGQISNGSVSVNASQTLTVCGVLNAVSPTSLVIGTTVLGIAPGATITGLSAATVGSTICLTYTVNPQGQISSGTVSVSAPMSLQICGVVTAITANSITIGDTVITLPAGTTLGSDVVVGANICISANVNPGGTIIPPITIIPNVTATIELCGQISAFVAATATTPGSITIGGVNLPIAPGATINGQVTVGANVRVRVTLNALGQITGSATVSIEPCSTGNVCGVVTAFVAATANAAGVITIGGITFVIAPGVTLAGQAEIQIGSNICLTPIVSPSTPGGPGTPGTPPIIIGGSAGTGLAGCLQFNVPEATFGLLRTAALPDGDLFSLRQSLSFTVVTPPRGAGVRVFTVGGETFSGTPAEIGAFPDTQVQGFGFGQANGTARAVSCTESFRAIDFVIASTGTTVGDTVRLFLQNPLEAAPGVRLIATFVVEANGLMVTQLHPDVRLNRNSRLGTENPLAVGARFNFTTPAGAAGQRTDLLTLSINRNSSALSNCFQLGIDLQRAGGSGAISFVPVDVVVERTTQPNDAANPGVGLLAQLGGGYPTGRVCRTICPECNSTCVVLIAPTSQSFTAAGGTGTVTITADAGCNFTTSSSAAFVTINSAPTSGAGTVAFTVAPNPSNLARTGTISIGGVIFTVNQAGGTGGGPGTGAREVRVVNASGSPGGTATVSVELLAQGDENALGFSLNFDPAVLSNPQVALGSAASGGQLQVNSAQAAQGRLGIAVAMPTNQTFAAGTRQVVTITFNVAAGAAAGATPITFSNQPIAGEVVNTSAATLPATFTGGTFTVVTGLESDVAPRPNGNGNLSIADWVQTGRFAAGVDTPSLGSEFQRADSAPRSSLGDGRLSIADWVQAGRYAAGIDPPTPQGGPTAPASSMRSDDGANQLEFNQSEAVGQNQSSPNTGAARVLRVVNSLSFGSRDVVRVEIDAQGNENALGFSLSFDPTRTRFLYAELGAGAQEASLQLNRNQLASGRLGVALALPTGKTLPAGTRQLVTIYLSRAKGANDLRAVRFADLPVAREVVDANADILSATYQTSNGTPFGRISMTNPSFESYGQALLAAVTQINNSAPSSVRPQFTPPATININHRPADESAPAEWPTLLPARAGGRSSFNHHLNE